jgi:hypothetical protein
LAVVTSDAAVTEEEYSILAVVTSDAAVTEEEEDSVLAVVAFLFPIALTKFAKLSVGEAKIDEAF